ncbi:hypothetical protein ACH3O9_11275 [Leeuwenhoekiella sp. A16]|uniref:hypothetical protein n=1 Tax=Leeuwenhoekiella sp. A16 TaxID=3141462 RepID=UPI003A7FB606
MERIKENPLSTIIGLLFIIVGFSLLIIYLFFETRKEISFFWVPGCWAAGLMLLFAKDKLLDIITLGLSRLVDDTVKKVKS